MTILIAAVADRKIDTVLRPMLRVMTAIRSALLQVFNNLCQLKDIGLAVEIADDLAADRQSVLRYTCRNGNSRQTRNIDGNSKDIAEVHCQGIIHMFTQFKRKG